MRNLTPTREHENRAEGIVGVVAAVAAWGFGPIFIKLIGLPGLTLVTYRLWLGFAVMALFTLVTRRRITGDDVRRAALGGALFGGNVMFFVNAIKHTSVADASLITALAPVLILVAAGPMFGEKVAFRDLVLTAVILAGVGLVVIGSSGSPEWSVLGDVLAVGALITWAAYFVATKRARLTMGTAEYQTVVMLVASLVATPYALLAGAQFVKPGSDDWFWLALFVVVPGAVGHGIMSWSHRYVDVSVSSLIVVAQPVVSAVAAAVFLDEGLGALQLLGGGIVLVAIGVLVHGHRPLEAQIVEAE